MDHDIRALRKQHGLRLRDVAARLGVATHVLSMWERGLAVPDRDHQRSLSELYGVSMRTLQDALVRHRRSAIPGEGYTTARPGDGSIRPRASEPTPGRKKLLDLFCGAGGFSRGFESTGEFVSVAGVDLLSDRIESFVANHRHAVGFAGDLRNFSTRQIEDHSGGVDVIIGGPPCQGFSSIRPFRTLTEGDPRNSLIEHFVLVVGKLAPEWFVFENVVGILTHQGGSRLQSLLASVESLGYAASWRVINAATFGVPQHRERVIVVGNKRGLPFSWPEPTHRAEYKSMAGRRREVLSTEALIHPHIPKAVTIRDAIDDLPPVAAGEEATRYSRPARTAYQRSMRGKCERLTLHRSTGHSDRMLNIIRKAGYNKGELPPGLVSSGFSSSYSRLHADEPSTTLTVNFVHPASNRCIHPSQDRALTPREGARLQSFPDDYLFAGTGSQIVKQIGNAVPPLLSAALASAILASEEKASRGRVTAKRRAALGAGAG